MLLTPLVDLLADPRELLEVLAADQDFFAVYSQVAEIALVDSLVSALVLVDVVALMSRASNSRENAAAVLVSPSCLAFILLLGRLGIQYFGSNHDAILFRPDLGSDPLLLLAKELLPLLFRHLPQSLALLSSIHFCCFIPDERLEPQLQDIVVLDVPVVVICCGGASACLVRRAKDRLP